MIQTKKINLYILLGVFMFSFCCFLTTTTKNSGIVINDSNQKGNIVGNTTISLPQSQSYNSSSLKFYSNESCNRYYDWTPMNNTGVSFETPSLYNSCISNINFTVVNSSIISENVESAPSTPLTYQRYEQAQGFNISTSSYLRSLSIYLKGKSAYNVTLQIKNQWNSTSFLYNNTIELSTATDWMNINLSSPVFVTPGEYYVWMDAVPSNGLSSWAESNTLISQPTNDTMYFDGADWVMASYRLTLIVNSSRIINPSDVNMTLNGTQVKDQGEGKGYLKNVLSNIDSSSSLNLPISTNSTDVLYSYNVSSYFSRTQTLIPNYLFVNSIPNWNITLNLDDPHGNYIDYYVKLTGFRSDYTNIQVYNGSNVISYTRPDPGTIILNSAGDLLTFQSPNYITHENIPQSIYSGGSFPLNISAKTNGNISIAIYSGLTKEYFNSTNNDSALFMWNVSSSIPSGNLSVNITYFGDNEVGYFERTINLIRQGLLNIQPIEAFSLQSFKISCAFKDKFTETPIQNAIVTFSISNITGTLNYDDSGNYSQTLDANIYALMPGNYNLTITAQSSGYQSVSINNNVTIEPRPVSILVSRSSSSLHPGNTLNLKIGVTDNISKTYLERPVNLELYVVHAGSNSTLYPIMFENFNATTQDVSYNWVIPKSTETGDYSILVKVKSDYYSGFLNLDGSLKISPQPSTWFIGPIIIAAGLLATGIYIQRKRVTVRHSVKGMLILHENGSTLAQRISEGFGRVNHALISSAVTGIISIIKEITGKGLRTIEIEGGYVNIAKGNDFWLVLFLEQNPYWIKNVILKCVDKVEKEYGDEISKFKGKAIPIEIDNIIKENFHVTILNNPLEESLKKKKQNSYGY